MNTSASPAPSGDEDPLDLPPPSSPMVRSGSPTTALDDGTPPEPGPETSRRRRRRMRPAEVDPRPGHIPGLDGIRAIAIAAVLVYHFTPTALPGGFIGVDVFFVLSGFLITTLLLRDVATDGRLNLAKFWIRRARRLLPALITVVVVSIAAARVVGGDLLVGIGRQALGAFTFSTNWLEIGVGSSYFHQTSPLLFVNFWSLAVEEQFYLLWPLALGLVLAFTVRAKQRTAFALTMAAGSALLMALLFVPGQDATRVYYGTDTHLFGLMIGVALAFAWAGPGRAGLRHPLWQRWRGTAVLVALATLILLMRVLTSSSSWTFRGGLVLACLATAVLIAGLLERGGPWRSVMASRPLGWLGSRSYGIYLWHWPVLIILGTALPHAPGTTRGTLVLIGALALTVALSEASYRLIETPVRRHGFRESLRRAGAWIATPWRDDRRPRIVAGLVIAALVMTVIAVLTAPDRSQTQQAIEDAEARLADAGPAPGAADPSDDAEGDADPPADGAPGEAEDPAGEPSAEEPPAEEPSAEEPSEQEPTEQESPSPEDEAASPDAERYADFTADEDGLLVPPANTMTAIGDSLVVTSSDGLTFRFPEINYAAQSNRQWGDAMPVLTEALAAGTVRENVIVHFGTNAGVEEAALRAFLEELGPDRNIVLMNLYSRSTFVPGSNEIIAEVAAEYPNVVVGDWNAAVTAEPQVLQADAVHPDIEGMHVYARVVAESFDALATGSD